jgi:hypothetical protein
LLTAALLQNVANPLTEGSTCTKDGVDEVAAVMLEGRYNLLETLWDDCDVALRGDIAALAAKEADGVLLSELSVARQRALVRLCQIV